MELKRLIKKYLILIIGLIVLRFLLNAIVPELFTKTTIGDGFTQSETTFFGLYQNNFFNIIIGLIMAVDLKKMRQNWIIIPITTMLSLTCGLFFFSMIILDTLIKEYEKV